MTMVDLCQCKEIESDGATLVGRRWGEVEMRVATLKRTCVRYDTLAIVERARFKQKEAFKGRQ